MIAIKVEPSLTMLWFLVNVGSTMLTAELSHKHMACMDDRDAFEPSSGIP